MKTAIMTDTNSGMTRNEADRCGVYLLAMPVIVDDKSYFEGIDITHDQLYAAMRAHRDIHSSQPSPGDVSDMWDAIFKDGYDELVYIPMSSGLSGSCEMAKLLARDYAGRVVVADNHRISVTLYESVLEARRMAQSGLSAERIAADLEKRAADSSIYITVDSLEYLRRSGRVTAAGAALAGAFDIKPVLTIQGGKLDAFAKVRGIKKSETRMAEAVRTDLEKRFAHFSADRMRIGAAGTFEHTADAEAWTDHLRGMFPGIKVYYQPLSCSIACHVGINAVGVGISALSDD